MSATVTYKGETLTTATNQTRTLETAGTYLEDDITLVDVSTIPSGTKSITTNGTHDVTNYASANVAVPASAVDSGTKSVSITSNGTTTEDVTGYASASITTNVPNSYTASDEGKVVSNGSLISQTSATYTANDTYDTTTINSVTVNVSGGGDDAYKFIDGSFSGAYVNNTITKIRNYALNFHTEHDFSFSSTSATSLGYNAFQGANITSFSAPNLTGAANNASTFNSAKKLTFADMGSLSKIYGNFAWNANALTVLVLRHTSVVTLDNVNTFGNTPIRGYNGLSGTIYVPSALIDSYKSASNWSSIFNEGYVTFTAIEGSIYE